MSVSHSSTSMSFVVLLPSIAIYKNGNTVRIDFENQSEEYLVSTYDALGNHIKRLDSNNLYIIQPNAHSLYLVFIKDRLSGKTYSQKVLL